MNTAPPSSSFPCARGLRASALALALALALSGCSLPKPPSSRPAIYDFGPGTLTTPTPTNAPRLTALAVADIETHVALDSPAVLYRLAYDNSQQLQPYAQARWSMPPAQLVRQRLREQLGRQRALLNAGDGSLVGTVSPLTLRLELEEFSQLFESPASSLGLLRLRATLVQPSPGGEKLVAQRNFIVQRPAATPDAPGGVRALTAATDAAVQEIEAWLQQAAP